MSLHPQVIPPIRSEKPSVLRMRSFLMEASTCRCAIPWEHCIRTRIFSIFFPLAANQPRHHGVSPSSPSCNMPKD
jgi:hypothetical protein